MNTGRQSKPVAPYLLPGLYDYWDARDSSKITLASGVVSAWAGYKGTTVTQGTSSRRPTPTIGGINGRASIYFDGTDDYLAITDDAICAMVNGALPAWTAAFVAYEVPPMPNDQRTICSWGYSTSYNSYLFIRLSSDYRFLSVFAKSISGASFSLSPGMPYRFCSGAPFLGIVRCDQKNYTLWVNGQKVYKRRGVDDVLGAGRFTMGVAHVSSASQVYYWKGHIGTIVLYKTPLDDCYIDSLSEWLRGEWGINA